MHRSSVKKHDALLQVSHVSVSYGRHQAVVDAALEVHAGEIVVILGANGAGKTSLLKAISGMVGIGAGALISVGGAPMAGSPAHTLVEAGLALVPEGRGIFGELSVRENLMLGAFAKRARDGDEQRLSEVFALFPRLRERQDQAVRTMSGGEQQMVAIGRAMMSKPQVLMLDEPSLGLSPLLSLEVFRTLRQIADTGIGILVVEQNARMSLAVANRGYLIETGHMSASYDAAAMLQDKNIQETYLGAHPSDHSPTPTRDAAPPGLQKSSFASNALPTTTGSQQAAHASPINFPIDDLVRMAAARSLQTQFMPAELPGPQVMPSQMAPVRLSREEAADIDNSIDAVVQRALASTRKRVTPSAIAPTLSATNIPSAVTPKARVNLGRKLSVEIYRRNANGDMVKE